MDPILPTVIDFDQLDDDHANRLFSASKTYGYFYLINHQLPLTTSDFYKLVQTQFFDLSLEEKLKLYPTSFIRSTTLSENLNNAHEQKELFLINQQELKQKDNNDMLKNMFEQCQMVKNKLLTTLWKYVDEKENVSRHLILSLQ